MIAFVLAHTSSDALLVKVQVKGLQLNYVVICFLLIRFSPILCSNFISTCVYFLVSDT